MSEDLLDCPGCSEKLTVGGYCFTCTRYPLGRIQPQRSSQVTSTGSPTGPRRSVSKSTAIETTSSNLEAQLEQLISAQNRTTYAVRSLALYFFISLQTALGGGGIISLALNDKSHYDKFGNLNSGATFFVTIGALIVIVGFFLAVILGRVELDKSKVK